MSYSEVNPLSDEQLRRELQVLQKRFSKAGAEHPAVEELRHEVFLNTGDEEELEIMIIVSDDTPPDKTGWKYIEPIENAIRQHLQKKGEGRSIYFSVGTRAESLEWTRPVEDIEDDAAA